VSREHPALRRALAEVEELYRQGLASHGTAPKSVGWKDEHSQTLRFQKLATLISGEHAPADAITVNDLGCGYGALFNFLDALPGVTLASYHGYDLSEEMLAAARLAADDRARFFQAATATLEADYSFVSGTFNVKGTAPESVWSDYVFATITELFSRSSRGMAFNVLTSYVDFRQPNLFYADPAAFFDYCKRELSPNVTLLHDYPLYEWTMLVHRA
jgi:SAM-dependent methyltransferase